MTGINLVLHDPAGRRAVPVDATPFGIGRSSENQLQLTDAQVSRRHAELVRIADTWRIRDCGSRFGTFVNDARVQEAAVGVGDRIRLGQCELRLEAADTAPTSGSSQFDFHQVNALLTGLRALGSSQVLDEVLAIVLDSALELTGAERGFILLADTGQPLTLRLARARGGVTLTTAQTSQRIPEEVFLTGTDRIVTDLLDGAHATHHAGTVALGIRHVLCTPLRVVQFTTGKDRRIGVLYLDSRERGYLQTAGALHALAAEAAVVIENARLTQDAVDAERAAQEMRIATEMQRALLPPANHVAQCAELSAVTTPCRAVGGDLFDYAVREDGSLAFAVADVAGKGISAALLTAVVQGLFAAEAETTNGPAEIMRRVNRALCRRAVAARFVTAFYGVLTPSGTLHYCNAGHNPPFLLTRDGFRRLTIGGTVLGLFDKSTFDAGSEAVAPGDLVVLFSDGVTEAENHDGVEFGDDRLAACLSAVSWPTAAAVVDSLQRALGDFCGDAAARDDVTLMALRAR